MRTASLLLIGALFTFLLFGCEIKEGDGDFDFDFPDSSHDFTDAELGSDKDSGVDASQTQDEEDAQVQQQDDAGTSDEDDSSEPNSTTVDDIPFLLADALCEALANCQGTELLSLSLLGKDCSVSTGLVFKNRDFVYLQDSIDEQRVVFEPDNIARCLEDISAQGCNVQSSRRPDSCEEAIAGTVAIGEYCVIDADCEGSAFCGPESAESCPTICQALISEDFECENSDQCADGLVCFSKYCVAPAVEGETCCLPDDDDTCWSAAPAPCQRGLECAADSSSAATCKDQRDIWKAKEDEACEPPNLMCEVEGGTPLSCVALDSSTMVCKKRVEAGSACRKAQPSQCPANQYCNAASLDEEGVCVDLPQAYEPCRDENKIMRCAPELVCDLYRGDLACVPVNENGYGCEGNRSCFSGTCGQDSNCIAPEVCENG